MKTLIKQIHSEALFSKMNSPIGELTIIVHAGKLQAILDTTDCSTLAWRDKLNRLKDSSDFPLIQNVKIQLEQYFKGNRTQFNLPLSLHGTAFQRQAWLELSTIPYGKTINYQQQAINMGNSKWARAAGGANGKNPLMIVIPCHRVIGKNGKLTGFRCGVNKKEFLINLEASQKH